MPEVSGKATHRFLAALLTLFALSVPVHAQGALPEQAMEALRAGQLAAAEAIATYSSHYPDRPLWREAIDQGERARSLAPGRLEPLRFLAQVYGVTGWTSRTWETWQQFLEAGGELDARSRADAARAALTLGYQAFTAGAMGRALDLLQASYELEPGDLTTVTYLGQARLESGDAEGAIPLLAEAAETYPQLRPQLTRATLGAQHGLRAADSFIAAEREFAQGNMAGALSLYTATIQGDPTFVEAIKGAAESNAALGRSGEARRLWERALSIDPDDDEVRAVLDRLDAAQEAEAQAAAEAALEAQQVAEAAAAAQAAAEAEAPPIVLAPPAPPPVVAEPEPGDPEAPEPDVAEPPEPEPDEPDEPEEPDEVVAEPPEPEPEPEPEPAAAGGPVLALLDATISPRAAEAGGEGAFTFMEAPAAAVGNLEAPVAYGQGTLHLQVQLIEKPTDEPVFVQFCVVPDDIITVSPACSDASRARLDSEGVVEISQSVTGLDGAGAVDWSQGLAQVLVVLRDEGGRPLDPRYAYDEQGRPLDVSAYYPMSLHVRAAIVPAGGSFGGW